MNVLFDIYSDSRRRVPSKKNPTGRCGPEQVLKWEGGLLMDTRTSDKEELIDLATRKQNWNKMRREICGPGDYLED